MQTEINHRCARNNIVSMHNMMTNIITIRQFKRSHAEDNDSIPRLNNVQHKTILSVAIHNALRYNFHRILV